jgi:hypothetical protein
LEEKLCLSPVTPQGRTYLRVGPDCCRTKAILGSEGELSKIVLAEMGQMVGCEHCPAPIVVRSAVSMFSRNIVLDASKVDRDRRPALNGS